jgi:phage-related protein
MVHSSKPRVVFYRSAAGREPVREWLWSLDKASRRVIGEDIKTVQLGWPLGMPLVRAVGDGLWEIRSRLRGAQARTVFIIEDGIMVLLHGFVKKSRKMPRKDFETARQRARKVTSG